jgi:hypothetical protein
MLSLARRFTLHVIDHVGVDEVLALEHDQDRISHSHCKDLLLNKPIVCSEGEYSG